MKKGVFMTFEGGEGSGKSTQLRLLAAHLGGSGREIVMTREPGGSLLGERIRALLLDPATRMDAMTQFLLFSAARRDHLNDLIGPAIDRGAVVLCDRFADSSRAYQGAGGALDPRFMLEVENAVVADRRPDLTLLLDLAPEAGLARARRRLGADLAGGDAFEAADLAFHERVRAGFLAIASAEPQRVRVVDAARDQDRVFADVSAIVLQHLATE